MARFRSYGVRLASAILLVSGALWAQRADESERVPLPIEEGTGLVFLRLPFGNGATNATVTEIVEDHSEFLWFGTKGSLNRFDGYRFRDFRPEPGNPHSLSGLEIRSLFTDSSGKIWVASDLSLDRYDPATENFSHYLAAPSVLEGPVNHISQDRAGMIWLSTAHGLTRIDPATGQMTRYLDPKTAVLRSTFEQRDGTFWVADQESVSVFDRATGRIARRIPLRNPAAARSGLAANLRVRLFEDHAGVLWVASERDGLATADPVHNRLSYMTLADGRSAGLSQGVWDLREDEQGVLWIGTDNGLLTDFSSWMPGARSLFDIEMIQTIPTVWLPIASELSSKITKATCGRVRMVGP